MKITRFQREHGPQVARLHRVALPDGFLSTLGDQFLCELYLGIGRDPQSRVWVALGDNGLVVGYLSGSADVRACYRHVLSTRAFHLARTVMPSLLSARVLKRVMETVLYPFRSSSSEIAAARALELEAELLSIAVAETGRGQGVGRALVASFEEFLGEYRYQGPYRVVTHAADPRSNAFYQSLGFQPAGQFRHHDHSMSVYTREASTSGRPADPVREP